MHSEDRLRRDIRDCIYRIFFTSNKNSESSSNPFKTEQIISAYVKKKKKKREDGNYIRFNITYKSSIIRNKIQKKATFISIKEAFIVKDFL